MHEVSIALDLLNIATEQCRKSGYSKIEAINLKIGRASGIMPDALIFSFDAIKKDSLADTALLNIEEVPVSGECSDCSSKFTVDEEYILSCPVCNSNSFNIISGREMDIIDMEVS
ncbi:MAG: hydrogenase maturation nickel metallochaperone HypA [Nitrospirae bacterium GWC2_42_7]|nr:MAG: hydrogenase maturation nickel metallochaperone HypA [Nitrospirae bacterium GWC2_42_7]